MSFWDWLRRGTARLAARELAQLHRRCGGDYAEVMRLSMVALVMATAQGKVSKKNAVILDQVLSKSIRNYVDLCVLCLYANTAPKWRTYAAVCTEFSEDVRHWLLAEGIPYRYMDGDNRERTNAIVDKLRDGLGFKGVFPDSRERAAGAEESTAAK